jgi:type II secretory pathway component PulC
MTKREKIILAAMAVAIIAGTPYLLLDRESKVVPAAVRPDFKPPHDFVNATAEALKKTALTEAQTHILEMASVEWKSDPFLGRKLAAVKPQAAGAGEILKAFAYTGFVIVGQSRLAVINGMEYEVGEVILGSELLVQAINPQNVTVKKIGGRESLNIPFTGEVLR